MAIRRRRRRRGTWFPNLGTANKEGGELGDDSAGVWAELIPGGGGSSNVFITDLTFDHFVDEGATAEGPAGRSLADFQGSEYLLQRIVGKLFVGLDQINSGGATAGVLVTSAFFVAREDEHTPSAFPNPIGAATLLDLVNNYGPDNTGHITEPWIWRRQWILGNALTPGGPGSNQAAPKVFPPTNAGYGSVMDGPHVDAKTKRHVHREDRLWFITAVRSLSLNWADPFNPDVAVEAHVKLHLDYRLFGTLLKAKNTGTF